MLTKTLTSNLKKQSPNLKTKLLLFLKCVVLSIIVFSIFILVSILLHNGTGNNIEKSIIYPAGSINSKYYLIAKFIMLIIIGPIIEELTFRSFLTLSIKGVTLFLSSLIFYPLYLLKNELNFWFHSLILITSIFSFYFLIKIITTKHKFYFQLLCSKANVLILLIISSVVFGLFHLSRVNQINSFSVLFICAITIHGFMLGYIRIKNGLLWSIALHMCINIPSFIAYL